MTKKSIIIANWKMNLGVKASVDLAKAISEQRLVNNEQLEIVICPSFPAIASVSNSLHSAPNIRLGAQDVFWEERGSFTGEVSALTLKELGCEYVVIGHSERRQYLGETNEMIHKKVKAALDAGLVPVLCVGENFDQRQGGQKDYVIMNQVDKALDGLDLETSDKIVIAYEPVWVIGSGQAIDPTEAEQTHRLIKSVLRENYPDDSIENSFRIVYGGSVDKDNVAEFMRQETIDGVLVGGASLRADEFVGIIEAVQKLHT